MTATIEETELGALLGNDSNPQCDIYVRKDSRDSKPVQCPQRGELLILYKCGCPGRRPAWVCHEHFEMIAAMIVSCSHCGSLIESWREV